MKIIKPSVELLTDFDGDDVLKFIEKCGRVCYRSEKKISDESAEKFVKMLIKRGHESVLEHFSCTFKIICDRGVMAELTRHRLASFSVESTRYCDYDELTFIKPCYWEDTDSEYENFKQWKWAMAESEQWYGLQRMYNAAPQEARAVLPMSLATTVIMTANLREWRHILKLRTSPKAHPQMRQIALPILEIFKNKLPTVFEDF